MSSPWGTLGHPHEINPRKARRAPKPARFVDRLGAFRAHFGRLRRAPARSGARPAPTGRPARLLHSFNSFNGYPHTPPLNESHAIERIERILTLGARWRRGHWALHTANITHTRCRLAAWSEICCYSVRCRAIAPTARHHTASTPPTRLGGLESRRWITLRSRPPNDGRAHPARDPRGPGGQV
jgi:hypothetical protein